MSARPELPERIIVDEPEGRVYIDGERFPYYLGEEGPRVEAPPRTGGVYTVWLPVLVDSVGIIPKEAPNE
ncbi:hypothetical protein SEA_NITRO_34 [Arthrobacter phage Nitro]|uniref:Uncharacterized protein n=1 Tax=Arthrobacter phage Nitro TaxID=3077792 RepID=A0AA96HF29_9CAUD|nr:hypothetical protein SEA_NITRO_34 [Arthrobacter phage Nitro]